MTWLTSFGLQRSRITVLVMMLSLIVGALTYAGFPKREDPAITVRTAIVAASNTGLELVQLEELVAAPIEETVRAIPGVSEVRTQLTGGAAIVQVDIADDVPEEDIKQVFDEIRDDIAAIAPFMPEDTQGPIVNSDFGDVAIATIAITGAGFSLPDLEDAAKALRDRLYALDFVAAVTLYGDQDEVITLQLDRARLASIGATLNPVLAALQGQNVRLPAGSVVSGDTRVPLETSGDVSTLEEIEDLLVDLPGLGIIRLGDLVEVRRDVADPAIQPVFQDGEPAIILSVEMAEGEDITAIGPVLRETVETFVLDQPIGIEAVFSTFQPEIVTDSVNGALINVAQTFAVVFLMMLLFLSWREAMVMASIVPFAVSFAFAFMGPFGVELQQVSIAAIIISLGLLVDNGLVIVEDMDRRIAAGENRTKAALAAGGQYTLPLLVASVTTVSAFLPLFLLDGTEGQYGYSLGIVVMLTLTGSFLSALYLLPRLAAWVIPEAGVGEKTHGIFDRLADVYAQLVRWVVRAPLRVLAVIGVVVVVGALQMPNVPNQMFPLSERAQILGYLDLPPGTDIAATEDVALRLSDWLTSEHNPEVTGVTSYIGSGGPRFVLSLDPADTDPASAFLVINTTSFETSGDVLDRARRHVAAAFPEASIRFKRLAMGGREPGVDIQISGPDADRLLWAAYEVETAFADAPGLIQNRNDWGARHLTGRIEIAQDRLREYGLTSRDVSQALSGFFDGRRISTFREGDEMVPIVLRGAPEDRIAYDAVANAAIEANGQVLSLDQFADLVPVLDFSTLRRVDQVRMVTVSAISESITAHDLLAHVQPRLDTLAAELGPAYRIDVAGEVENAAEVRTKLGAGLPAALAVMLLALMIQFNSFRRVGITLLSVPLVLPGAPLALLITGQPLSFFGTLGLIALMGIIINNAIVMVDQIDIDRQTLPLDEAIVAAARKRFRPILLTSMTTVMGLAPMAIAGGALWEPMATLMMGGLGVASVLALFWVPALYRLFMAGKATVSASAPAATAQLQT